MRYSLVLALLIGCGDDSAAVDAGGDSSFDSGVDASLDAGIEYQTHAEIQIAADDGSATLVIAPNSLPVGVEAGDISVTSGATSAVFSSDARLQASYELLPDGLVFREAARLEIAGPVPSPAFGLLDSVNSVEVVGIQLDRDGDMVTGVVASIPHFTSFFLAVAETSVTGEVEALEDTTVTMPTWTNVRVNVDDIPPVSLTRGGRTAEVTLQRAGEWTGFLDTFKTRLSDLGILRRVDIPGELMLAYDCTDAGEMEAEVYLEWEALLTYQVSGAGGVGEGTVTSEAGKWLGAGVGTCFSATDDGVGDWVDSDSMPCTLCEQVVDIREFDVAQITPTPDETRLLFNNTAYPCDVTTPGGAIICPMAPGEFPEGAMWVGAMRLGADVPLADRDHSLIYALVFESDGVTENDWQFVEPFVWDYFQGTDRWYQLIWDHLTRTWSVRVTQVDESQTQTTVSSAVRVVIIGDVVQWFVPRIELPSATPRYRFSAFIHEGTFARAERGGDVSGTDPTQPLRMAMP